MRPSAFSLPLLLTVLAWGFNFVALKLVYEQVSPAATSLIRFVITFAAMIPLCLLLKESLRYPKGEAVRILWLGFVAMGAYMILFLEGLARTTPADSAIILATAPIFTYFFAIAAKQEFFSFRAFLGSLVAFVGVGIVVLGAGADDNGTLLGNSLTLASSVVWAYSAVFSKPLMQSYSPARVFTLAMPGSLLALLPYGAYAVYQTDFASLTPTTWGMMLHVALLAGALGFTGFYIGVRQVGAAGAMLYQFLVPPIAMLSAVALLDKRITTIQVAGFALVVVGVIWATRARRKADTAPAP